MYTRIKLEHVRTNTRGEERRSGNSSPRPIIEYVYASKEGGGNEGKEANLARTSFRVLRL